MPGLWMCGHSVKEFRLKKNDKSRWPQDRYGQYAYGKGISMIQIHLDNVTTKGIADGAHDYEGGK